MGGREVVGSSRLTRSISHALHFFSTPRNSLQWIHSILLTLPHVRLLPQNARKGVTRWCMCIHVHSGCSFTPLWFEVSDQSFPHFWGLSCVLNHYSGGELLIEGPRFFEEVTKCSTSALALKRVSFLLNNSVSYVDFHDVDCNPQERL